MFIGVATLAPRETKEDHQKLNDPEMSNLAQGGEEDNAENRNSRPSEGSMFSMTKARK